MARLLSVNVGLPRDIDWKGRTVHTGIWKYPVIGRCRVGRLNLAGDGQGDLGGHGGEQRAVFVYQVEAYRHWEAELHRNDFVHGQFGENFTVTGLPDTEVCIGDRYRIGSALFEVTQPRVTCYRVGIRTNEPRMPALLVAAGLPGFYLRVLSEGDVGAGDEIVKVGAAAERMTVAQTDALLYSSRHPREQLERALRIEALSKGWRGSFDALLRRPMASGNAGLAPAAARQAAAPGFQRLSVTAVESVSDDVIALSLQSADGQALTPALPGQYLVLRLQVAAGEPPVLRSYSVCGRTDSPGYRIGVKVEPDGRAGRYVRDHVKVGDVLDVSAPRGGFTLQGGEGPVLLMSAGIGVTPVLAMLNALAMAHTARRVSWIHVARDGRHHPFAAEARRLVDSLAQGCGHVRYTRPSPSDVAGRDFDGSGRLSLTALRELPIAADSEAYVCGPIAFMADMKQALASLGVASERLYTETFNGGASLTPGIAATATRPPHAPEHEDCAGPRISFARSGVSAHWNGAAYRSILELAEACDVPARWSCRSGVCHNCESGLISGSVAYEPDPLDLPATGNVLICCAMPRDDLVVDL
ncbi:MULTISPECIES: MOSC and FAD-binding oxidoreductase domain-containing protein [unclassified Achromobacter]|uniref:MOSC and FAD-binding oxidoreductase domain-containing protein n=1 Tax=unclassified Achromobacter TaxID=2626865 RepID=UPI000B51D219|nr:MULTISPECIES: MOSC and FAD-binding oxidoreductase domain-containing protein [unclassified Achromobacter]OWT72986.1 sulfurase [Achromobacter sp. HZ34]OWT74205.1 sulfurase [Achromobacter sp. HZ28]